MLSKAVTASCAILLREPFGAGLRALWEFAHPVKDESQRRDVGPVRKADRGQPLTSFQARTRGP